MKGRRIDIKSLSEVDEKLRIYNNIFEQQQFSLLQTVVIITGIVIVVAIFIYVIFISIMKSRIRRRNIKRKGNIHHKWIELKLLWTTLFDLKLLFNNYRSIFRLSTILSFNAMIIDSPIVTFCFVVAVYGSVIAWCYPTFKPIQPLYDFMNSNNNNNNNPDWFIVYNMYLPSKPTAYRQSLHIIEEHMNQIGKSYAATKSPGRLSLFYHTIGRKISDDFMNYQCSIKNDFNCYSHGYSKEGYEEDALTTLYNYCQKYPNKIAIYIHSKGTYHTNIENQLWRRHMTYAVTSNDCLVHLNNNNTCNVCGLLFQPIWTLFFPGNMWSASCTYVNELLPPKEYAIKLTKLMENYVLTNNDNDNNNDMYYTSLLYNITSPGNLGRDRFAAEHWIASHPSIIPCDLSKESNILYWRTNDHFLQNNNNDNNNNMNNLLSWSIAPRHNITSNWYRLNQTILQHILLSNNENDNNNNNNNKQSTLVIKQPLWETEYYLLSGHLLKWKTLYNKLPNKNSWVWDYFPNGEYFYNNKEILILLQQQQQKQAI